MNLLCVRSLMVGLDVRKLKQEGCMRFEQEGCMIYEGTRLMRNVAEALDLSEYVW